MTAQGRQPDKPDPDRSTVACPTCSPLAPPYGQGIMTVVDTDGWRHASICTTCQGWGRVHRTRGGTSYTPAPFWGPDGTAES
ncbi:hypothetical protein ACRYCC_21200 [Actinomadura scrupuli]|uniref:hypothetical protein n=1 Tax=Actinomadura scrupuli TaxID=559629 RepID=UPI003D952B96